MKEFVLTKKDVEAAQTLIPKSNKVIVRYVEPIFNALDQHTGIAIPELAKAKMRESVALTDMKKYLKYHPNSAVVVSVGIKIAEEENYEIGDIVLLRTVPGPTDFIMYGGEDYFAIDNAMILCSIKSS